MQICIGFACPAYIKHRAMPVKASTTGILDFVQLTVYQDSQHWLLIPVAAQDTISLCCSTERGRSKQYSKPNLE